MPAGFILDAITPALDARRSKLRRMPGPRGTEGCEMTRTSLFFSLLSVGCFALVAPIALVEPELTTMVVPILIGIVFAGIATIAFKRRQP
jgi:hypothetical protein